MELTMMGVKRPTKKFVPNAVKAITNGLNVEVQEDERVEGFLSRNLDNTGVVSETGHLFQVEIAAFRDDKNHEITRYFVVVRDEGGKAWLTHYPLTVYQLTHTLQRVRERFGVSL